MSELSSLYVRVHLSAPAMQAFEQSAPAHSGRYGDWRPWLDAATFYGTIGAADIEAIGARLAGLQVRAYLDNLCASRFNGPAESRYDPQAEVWTLAVTQCAENYRDFIEVLSIVRGIADYKDRPGEDLALIFPFLWGGPPEAHLRIAAGASALVMPAPEAAVAEASAFLQRVYEQFTAQFDPHDL